MPCSYSYPYGDSDFNSNAYFNCDSDGHRDCDGHCEIHPNSHSYCYCDIYTDADSYSHIHCDCNRYGDSHCNANSDADLNPDGHSHGDSKDTPDSSPSPNSAATPIAAKDKYRVRVHCNHQSVVSNRTAATRPLSPVCRSPPSCGHATPNRGQRH